MCGVSAALLSPPSFAGEGKPGAGPITASFDLKRPGDSFQKMQDHIDRLRSKQPLLQRLSRGNPTARRSELGQARLRPKKVSKSATADFDAPFTAVAAQAFGHPNDQCGPASSSDSIPGAYPHRKLASMRAGWRHGLAARAPSLTLLRKRGTEKASRC